MCDASNAGMVIGGMIVVFILILVVASCADNGKKTEYFD